MSAQIIPFPEARVVRRFDLMDTARRLARLAASEERPQAAFEPPASAEERLRRILNEAEPKKPRRRKPRPDAP